MKENLIAVFFLSLVISLLQVGPSLDVYYTWSQGILYLGAGIFLLLRLLIKGTPEGQTAKEVWTLLGSDKAARSRTLIYIFCGLSALALDSSSEVWKKLLGAGHQVSEVWMGPVTFLVALAFLRKKPPLLVLLGLVVGFCATMSLRWGQNNLGIVDVPQILLVSSFAFWGAAFLFNERLKFPGAVFVLAIGLPIGGIALLLNSYLFLPDLAPSWGKTLILFWTGALLYAFAEAGLFNSVLKLGAMRITGLLSIFPVLVAVIQSLLSATDVQQSNLITGVLLAVLSIALFSLSYQKAILKSDR